MSLPEKSFSRMPGMWARNIFWLQATFRQGHPWQGVHSPSNWIQENGFRDEFPSTLGGFGMGKRAHLPWRLGCEPTPSTRLSRQQSPFGMLIKQHIHRPFPAVPVLSELQTLGENRELTDGAVAKQEQRHGTAQLDHCIAPWETGIVQARGICNQSLQSVSPATAQASRPRTWLMIPPASMPWWGNCSQSPPQPSRHVPR